MEEVSKGDKRNWVVDEWLLCGLFRGVRSDELSFDGHGQTEQNSSFELKLTEAVKSVSVSDGSHTAHSAVKAGS
ncbi:hypothetical protein ACOMHN_018232 [Nucella lapillus]